MILNNTNNDISNRGTFELLLDIEWIEPANDWVSSEKTLNHPITNGYKYLYFSFYYRDSGYNCYPPASILPIDLFNNGEGMFLWYGGNAVYQVRIYKTSNVNKVNFLIFDH